MDIPKSRGELAKNKVRTHCRELRQSLFLPLHGRKALKVHTLFPGWDSGKAESLKVPVTRHYPDCGSDMESQIATFFFGDGGEAWDIPLLVCPNSASTPFAIRAC
jgi:hypothetical protein